jgi:hypothetical protein
MNTEKDLKDTFKKNFLNEIAYTNAIPRVIKDLSELERSKHGL